MANVKQNPSNITAKIQLDVNLGISTAGSTDVDNVVKTTPNCVGWFYDETSGVLTVYLNLVPDDDGAKLLTKLQTVYPNAVFLQ